MRQPLVAGNWKMNGTLSSVEALVGGILSGLGDVRGAEMALCPPYVFLSRVGELIRGEPLALGAQNASERDCGAFTGEVACAMLRELGCRYVIVGHSERRALHHETDELVARKAAKVAAEGMTPIVCVGETLEERESGRTEQVVGRQLDAVAALEASLLGAAVLAYEPVWAIGTGRSASPEQANEVHEFIRARIAKRSPDTAAEIRILYGGSVKGANAAALFAMPEIDGGLIGGASLQAEDFLAICAAAS